jgi:hypothetical protein
MMSPTYKNTFCLSKEPVKIVENGEKVLQFLAGIFLSQAFLMKIAHGGFVSNSLAIEPAMVEPQRGNLP